MKLIAIETATDICSVALLSDGELISEITLTIPRSHAENLVPLIRDVLLYGNIVPADLSGVAVSMGPGSYTGLRIGVSTAKGLSFATGARLVGVPSLEAMALSATMYVPTGDLIIPAFNSRKNEVYVASYRTLQDGSVELVRDSIAVSLSDIDNLKELVSDDRVWLAGEGAVNLENELKRNGSQPVKVLDPNVHVPSAAWIGRIATQRLERGLSEDLASFEPRYLKEFVAKKRKGSIFERLPF